MVQKTKLQVLWVYQLQKNLPEDLHLSQGNVTSLSYDSTQGLLPYYEQAQRLAVQSNTPCLLLFEGESFISQDTLIGYIEHVPEFTVYAQITHPDHIELCPRLFSPSSASLVSLQGQRFISLSEAPQEHIPLELKAVSECVYMTDFSTTDSDPDLLFLKAYQHFKAMQDQQALEGFKALMTTVPPDTFWGQLSTVMYLKTLWETKDYQFAFEELERLRQENTALENFPSLWILRGVIAQQFQAIDMAFECFDMVSTLQNRPNFALQHLFIETSDVTWKPLLGSAELALKEGMYIKAAGLFKQAADYLPDHDYVLSGWLQSAFLIRRYDDVERILSRETALRGVSDVARQSLSAFFELRQNKAETIEESDLLTAYQKDPSYTPDAFTVSIWVEIAVLCLQQNKVNIARAFFLQILHYQPEEVMLWHNLAYSYFAEKNYTKAEEYYRQALKVAPHYPNSQFDLAKTLVMQSRQHEAIEVLEDLLTVHPRFNDAQRALKDLKSSLPDQPTASLTSDLKIPFVFAFPLQALWTNGLDLVMKAYYEEFVPSDQVILALPVSQSKAPKLVHEARQWALDNFEEDLLCPVVLLDEEIPLIPGYGAWVLPWRIQPHENVLNFLQEQNYPIVAPAPLGDLKTLWQADAEAEKAWQAVSVEQLRQQMRAILEGTKEPFVNQDMLSTHSLLALEQETTTPSVSTQRQETSTASLIEKAPTIGVCMIVKNEEAVIEQALHSVLNSASEVVVVDTGSTDTTLEKLYALQTQHPQLRVFHFDWCDDFSAARNAAFDHATADWVLFLDADEYIKKDFIPSLRLELEQHQADAYCFKVHSVLEDGTLQESTSLGGVPRLFPNSKDYRFEGRIHEVVYHRERDKMRYIYPKSLPIYHVGYRAEIIEKKNKPTRDRELMLLAIKESPTARSTKRLYGILARDYLNTGNLAEAEKYLEAGLEQAHDDARVHEELFYQRQRLRVQQGQLNEALTAISSYEHKSSRFYLFQGRLRVQNKQWHEGYQVLLQALSQWKLEFNDPDPLDLRPEQQAILSELVEVTRILQKPEESLHYLERYLKLQTTPEPALWKRYRQLASQVELTV